jgi:hypothetical protein
MIPLSDYPAVTQEGERAMANALTDAAVRKYRSGPQRREIPDANTGGLYLVIQPNGHWLGRRRGVVALRAFRV